MTTVILFLIRLSYIFLAKQEISEAYTTVPAKTHVLNLGILAPAHEANTLVRRCMAISSHYDQEHTVLTVDQALFCNRRVKLDF